MNFQTKRVSITVSKVLTVTGLGNDLTGSTVNLRRSPAGQLIRRVPIGTQAEVLLSRDGWSQVRIGNETGYMQSSFLRREDDPDALLERIKQLEARLDKAGL